MIKLLEILKESIQENNTDYLNTKSNLTSFVDYEPPVDISDSSISDSERQQRFEDEILPYIKHIKAESKKFTSKPLFQQSLVQDTLIQAFRKIESFSKDTNIKAWLATIMRNLFLNKMRSRKMEKNRPSISTTIDNPSPAILSYGSDEIDLTNLDEPYSDETRKALDKLSPEIKKVLELYLDDYSEKEISDTMGIPMGTVKSRINRAKTQLRGMMRDPNPSVTGTFVRAHKGRIRGANRPLKMESILELIYK